MIEYSAIKGSFKLLGFGEEFLSWVDLLLVDFASATTNNGHLTDPIPITRSCHQGCPTTPLFYLACGEILAREIKKNSSIHGIQINQLQHIMAQFTDDTQFYLDSKRSVEEVIQTLTDIESNIGLKVNYEKSSIHTLAGADPFLCSKPLVWDPGGLEILGFNISNTPEINYENLLSKAKQTLSSWTH